MGLDPKMREYRMSEADCLLNKITCDIILLSYINKLILIHNMIIIKITCPDVDEARKISKHLLQKRIISSANYFPIKSISSWTGEIQEVDEYLVFLKTRKNNWEKVRDEVIKIHPYKVPCIIKIDAEANEDYESWINKQTK